MIRTRLSILSVMLLLMVGIIFPSAQYLAPALAQASAAQRLTTTPPAPDARPLMNVARIVAPAPFSSRIQVLEKTRGDIPERYVESRHYCPDPGGPDLIFCQPASVITPVVFQALAPQQQILRPSGLQYPQERPPRV
ncbi:hypothetical protein GCM10019059_33810 [Camelimonas fluminis]|uniref:Uncharacterized protein n=1 Tax=Camelimonas fluminis TaxID=1576911 RepID=A0ABV7UIG0_9HYPH|nr:hypothetical protein [Camelimonas fluminis]GHE71398.1 hypothetical protein GCM10019059_33810 [Camelimonas fluminis]